MSMCKQEKRYTQQAPEMSHTKRWGTCLGTNFQNDYKLGFKCKMSPWCKRGQKQ